MFDSENDDLGEVLASDSFAELQAELGPQFQQTNEVDDQETIVVEDEQAGVSDSLPSGSKTDDPLEAFDDGLMDEDDDPEAQLLKDVAEAMDEPEAEVPAVEPVAESEGDPGAAPTEEDDDSERLDLPDLRKRYRDSGKEVKRLQKELETANERSQFAQDHAESAAVQEPDPLVKEAAEYSANDLMTYLGRVAADQAEGKFKEQALKLLEYKPASEVAAVMKEAMLGKFGDISEDIEGVGRSMLPIVQAVESDRQREVGQQAEWTRRNEASLRYAVDSGVKITADGKLDISDAYTSDFVAAGREVLVQIPHLSKLPNAASIVLEYKTLKDQVAAGADSIARVSELEAEVTRLKSLLGKGTRSLPTGEGQVPRTTQAATSSEDMLSAEMADAFATG